MTAPLQQEAWLNFCHINDSGLEMQAKCASLTPRVDLFLRHLTGWECFFRWVLSFDEHGRYYIWFNDASEEAVFDRDGSTAGPEALLKDEACPYWHGPTQK